MTPDEDGTAPATEPTQYNRLDSTISKLIGEAQQELEQIERDAIALLKDQDAPEPERSFRELRDKASVYVWALQWLGERL